MKIRKLKFVILPCEIGANLTPLDSDCNLNVTTQSKWERKMEIKTREIRMKGQKDRRSYFNWRPSHLDCRTPILKWRKMIFKQINEHFKHNDCFPFVFPDMIAKQYTARFIFYSFFRLRKQQSNCYFSW